MIKPISFIVLLFALLSCKQEEPEVLGKTESFHITSGIVEDQYEIFVYLPPTYNPSARENQLIIALDGEFRFNDIRQIIAEKSQKGTLPSALFIGIGNDEKRNRDYTPTSFKHGTGGAQKFYLFIINELIPELDARYKIDPANAKTLIGNSFGGLFTQFVMFQERESNPFNKFVSVGCSYWFDSGVIFEYEEQYAQSHIDLPVKFFNGMGTLEGGISLASFAEMNERLSNRPYASFQSEASLIKKHGHKGAATLGFQKGLDYVFDN